MLRYLACLVFLPLVYLPRVSLCSLTFVLWINERLIQPQTQKYCAVETN